MKSQKYADFTTGVDFIPFAIETSGTWGEQGFHLVMEIGRRLATVQRGSARQRLLGGGDISALGLSGY